MKLLEEQSPTELLRRVFSPDSLTTPKPGAEPHRGPRGAQDGLPSVDPRGPASLESHRFPPKHNTSCFGQKTRRVLEFNELKVRKRSVMLRFLFRYSLLLHSKCKFTVKKTQFGFISNFFAKNKSGWLELALPGHCSSDSY